MNKVVQNKWATTNLTPLICNLAGNVPASWRVLFCWIRFIIWYSWYSMRVILKQVGGCLTSQEMIRAIEGMTTYAPKKVAKNHLQLHRNHLLQT